MTNPDFLKEVEQSLDRMDEDVRAHFHSVTRMLMACYLDDSQKAAVFFTRGQNAPVSLVSVNADDEELSEMVIFMNELTSKAALIGSALPNELH